MLRSVASNFCREGTYNVWFEALARLWTSVTFCDCGSYPRGSLPSKFASLPWRIRAMLCLYRLLWFLIPFLCCFLKTSYATFLSFFMDGVILACRCRHMCDNRHSYLFAVSLHFLHPMATTQTFCLPNTPLTHTFFTCVYRYLPAAGFVLIKAAPGISSAVQSGSYARG